jgi:hypothetical protein
LAGEAAADDINGSDLLSAERANVVKAWNSRPVFRQHAPAEWIDLAERDGLEPARALQAQVEATDAREER